MRDRGGHSLDGVLNCEGGVDIPSEEVGVDQGALLFDRDKEAPLNKESERVDMESGSGSLLGI